ncbi:MAG TPA: helix-turn-helix domain-containing protein [Bacilli bacterium]|jgi:excisionase family DNA binding protein|nr:helix-turn-helix domain-containing protein [Bacilli bacterium]HPZ23662.1 helix-turn-helix domain-containing protein [Bacilli bacterium]HQC83979.1 helix-turn-helix domain-containing protein [Bacilli bacterium]
MNERLIYTVQEVATILHSSPNYIYDLINKGYLPAIKLGSIKVIKTSLEKFLIQNEGNDLSDINNIKRLVTESEVK